MIGVEAQFYYTRMIFPANGFALEADQTALIPQVALNYLLLDFGRREADDDAARRVDDQFMLGDELLVAPAFSEEANATRDVFLPRGSVWVHLWAGATFDCRASSRMVHGRSPIGAPLVYASHQGAHFPLFDACTAPHRGPLELIA